MSDAAVLEPPVEWADREERFGVFVAPHRERACRLAGRLVGGDEAAAEDVTQEVFSSLPRKLRSFRGEAKFSAWLCRITTNLTIDYIRKQSARSNAMDSWGELERMNRASLSEQREELSWLQEAMSTLSSELRSAGWL